MSEASESGPVSLPKGWVVTTVGDVIISIDAGKSPDCPDIPASSGEWGVLKVSAVQPDGFKSQENKIIVNKAWINPAYEVQDGDLLISRSNTFQLVGIVCHVRSPQPRLMLCDKTLRMRVDPRRAMTDFVFWQFQQPSARRHIEVHATGTSGSMKNISQPSIRSLKIQLPPLPQQRKIARILTTLDNVITQTEALIAKYQAIKQGLMHDLFTRGVDATGKLRPPQSEAPELYKQSELGWIPKEWDCKTIGEVCGTASGGTPSRDVPSFWNGDIPWVKTGEVRYCVILDTEEKITESGMRSSAARLLPKGTVVLALFGQGPTRGRAAILGTDATVNQACLALLPSFCVTHDYLYFALVRAYDDIRGLSNDGAQQNLNSSLVRSFPIPIPNALEQQNIVARLKCVEASEHQETDSLSKLRLLKSGLMQDLLTGKVPVKADEPEEITP